MAPTTFSPARSSKPRPAGHHVRSISLPYSRSHPILSHLHATTTALRSCLSNPASPAAGLANLHALHAALADLLLLPESRAALDTTTSSLLDAFLLLADAHGAFQEALLDIRRHAADVHAALRQAEKELARIAASVRKCWPAAQQQLPASATVAEVEMSGVLADDMATFASVSAAVFSAVETMSTLGSTVGKTPEPERKQPDKQ